MYYASAILETSGFTVEERNLGDGCMWLHARRGAGGPLVNMHIDTVPADAGWSRDPHVLALEGSRAIGLGACDIKGALAAFLVAAARTRGAVELLLTSDEEAGTSRCVRAFVEAYDVKGRTVLVAEPTMCRAVLGHRGIAVCIGTFTGTAGHASLGRALVDSAVHEALRWGARALSYSEARDVRFNLGRIEGGTKANMIASSTLVRFGVRPLSDPSVVVRELCALAADPARVTWQPGYTAPALIPSNAARTVALGMELVVGDSVDFFTEAALFQEAGAVALVVGPGDIAQAHAADEHVEVAQLEEAGRCYARLLSGTAP
jgi:acetylornithine deacetylase